MPDPLTNELILQHMQDPVDEYYRNSDPQHLRPFVDMCNQYVSKVFRACGYYTPQLDDVHTFFPFHPNGVGAELSFSINITNATDIIPPLISGDIVIFYNRITIPRISHVMIATGTHSLIGTNNCSTFVHGETPIQMISTLSNRLQEGIICVQGLSPLALYNYHHPYQ